MQFFIKHRFATPSGILAGVVFLCCANGMAAGDQIAPKFDPQWYLHVPVGAMHFSPDGKLIAVRFGDVIFFETATAKMVHVLKADDNFPEGYIYSSFDWSPDGKHYVAGIGGTDGELWGTVQVWNRKTRKRVLKYRAFDGEWKDVSGGALMQVRFSADGRYLVSTFGKGSLDPGWREIQVREFPRGKVVRKFRTETHHVAISPDSSLVSDGWKFWSVKTGRLLVRRTEGGPAPLERIQFSPDGKTLFIGSDNSLLAGNSGVYDVKTGKMLRRLPRGQHPNTFDLNTGRQYPVAGRDLGFSPDGRILALQEKPAGKNVLILRDMKSGRLLHRLTGHERGVHSVAISPDGKLVLTGAGERTVRFWDLKTGELLRKIVLPAPKPPPSPIERAIDDRNLYRDKDGRLRRRKRSNR